MKTADRQQRLFTARTANIYRHQRERAAKAGVTLDYDLAALRDLATTALSRCGCVYCGISLTVKTLSIDHRTSIARGGAHVLANLAVCCEICNQAKGQMTDCEYIVLLDVLSRWPTAARRDAMRRLRAGGKAIHAR